MNSTRKVKIVVDDIPPSNNRFMGKNGKNWEYSKFKKMWAVLIKEALGSRSPETPFNKALVHIHYIFPDRRRRDPDNYSGKMILDPLVSLGVLEDDTFNNVSLSLSAESVPKMRKTIIEVESEEQN